MATKSSSKKKFIILGAAIAGMAVIGAVGFVLFTKLTSVSQADYRAASSDANTSESKLSDLHIAITSLGYTSTSTKTEITNDIDSAKKALSEYNDAVKKLSSQKATKKGETAKQYKKFKDINDKYTPMVEAYLSSSSKILVPISDCQTSLKNATASTSAAIAELTNCVTTLSAVNDLTDTDIKSMLDTTVNAFKSFKSTVEQLSATLTSDYTKRSQLRTQYYDAEDDFLKKLRDIDSNIEKKFKDNDPQDELRTLSDGIFNASLKK
jgi:predicted  nucleic acid-binding Zn-ribbon protein